MFIVRRTITIVSIWTQLCPSATLKNQCRIFQVGAIKNIQLIWVGNLDIKVNAKILIQLYFKNSPIDSARYSDQCFNILGDFCGKREWWFHGIGNKTLPMKPDFSHKMKMLFYYDYKYCVVDMMKRFSDPDNSE